MTEMHSMTGRDTHRLYFIKEYAQIISCLPWNRFNTGPAVMTTQMCSERSVSSGLLRVVFMQL